MSERAAGSCIDEGQLLHDGPGPVCLNSGTPRCPYAGIDAYPLACIEQDAIDAVLRLHCPYSGNKTRTETVDLAYNLAHTLGYTLAPMPILWYV